MNRYWSVFLVLSAPTLGFAQSYEKKGLPCTAELCIGDGLQELGKMKWDRARAALSLSGKPDFVGSRSLDHFEVEAVKRIYPGDIAKAMSYLSYEAFDGTALPLLAGVKVACDRKELRGTFASNGGNPTTVKISLVPDKQDLAIQHWTVTSISRDFPAAKSGEQQADVRKQLNERYGRFSVSRGIQRGVDAMYSIHENPLMGGGYGFDLSLNPRLTGNERYLQNQACGGKKKVSVD